MVETKDVLQQGEDECCSNVEGREVMEGFVGQGDGNDGNEDSCFEENEVVESEENEESEESEESD